MDGAKLSDVYNIAEAYVKKEKPSLLDKMTKTLGFVTGIEFRESSLVIGPKNNAVIKKGMVFNVNLGFADLENPDSSDDRYKKYALFLSDTVVVADVKISPILHLFGIVLFNYIFIRLSLGARYCPDGIQKADKKYRHLFEG